MAPVIHLIRDTQGWHNYFTNPSIPDPTLTNRGIRQCVPVQIKFPHHDKITHILASPLKRTIQTAVHCFQPAIDRGILVQPMPEVAENEPNECNRGEKPEDVIGWARSTFGGGVLDEQMFRLMPSNCLWFDQSAGIYEYEESKLHLRARIARQLIRRIAMNAGDDAHIAVVTHSQFLPYLTQAQGPYWKIAEWRTYAIESNNNATLKRINLWNSEGPRGFVFPYA